MRKIFLFCLFVFYNIINTNLIFSQGLIIADHNCINLKNIPENWITKAKSDLRIAYGHTSHGSQLVTGLEALKGTHSGIYQYSSSGWGYEAGIFLNDFGIEGAEDLGHYGDLAWVDATCNLLKRDEGCDRNVIIWSWYGGVSDNDEAGIDKYLNKIDSLEKVFPTVKFVYMTGHLDGTGKDGNLNVLNNRIRNYCINNNKILFDFADIESYEPYGSVNLMEKNADDACNYDSDGDNEADKNWAEEWMDNNTNSDLFTESTNCGECAHSISLNCVIKGRALWWLFCRMAGWDGTPLSSNTNEQSQPFSFNVIPISNSLNLIYKAEQNSYIDISIYDTKGVLVYKDKKEIVKGFNSLNINPFISS
nr:hypothetical protein [Bacteroidales bacterium]